jgi:hypothetical protein
MMLSQIVIQFQTILNEKGDAKVCFANYLEETAVNEVTTVLIRQDRILLMHEDGGELSEQEENYLPLM